MDFKTYQEQSYTAIQSHTDQKDEVLNWVVGLSEEVGEVMSIVKHVYYGHEPFSPEELAKEAGDVLWYLSALCTACNLNFETVAQLNLSKLQHRFSDGEFSDERSAERHALEQKFSDTQKYRDLMDRLYINK